MFALKVVHTVYVLAATIQNLSNTVNIRIKLHPKLCFVNLNPRVPLLAVDEPPSLAAYTYRCVSNKQRLVLYMRLHC